MADQIKTWQDRTEEKLKELGAAFLGKQTEIVMDALRAENAELRAALQAQQGDAERLDFVEAHPEKQLRKHKRHWSFVGFTNCEYDVFKTVREAIDDARSKK